jgi:hypothetical protein
LKGARSRFKKQTTSSISEGDGPRRDNWDGCVSIEKVQNWHDWSCEQAAPAAARTGESREIKEKSKIRMNWPAFKGLVFCVQLKRVIV